MYIKNSDLHNFAADNTVSRVSSSLNKLISELRKEGNIATQWFRDNSMIVKPEKFQAIIPDTKNQNNNPQKITIDTKVVISSENVILLGLEFGSKLNFDEHISKICNKSTGQLNPLCRIEHSIVFKERKILINSFIYANFNYCLLVCHFSSKKSINKIGKGASKFPQGEKCSYSELFWSVFSRIWTECGKILTNALWNVND